MKNKLMALTLVALLAAPAWAEPGARLRLPQGARAGERLSQVPAEARWSAAPTKRRSHAKTGAIAGGVALGVAGGLVGIGVCDIASEGNGCSSAAPVAVFALASAAVGAGVGALVGWAIKKD
jgi:hypothetical protein